MSLQLILGRYHTKVLTNMTMRHFLYVLMDCQTHKCLIIKLSFWHIIGTHFINWNQKNRFEIGHLERKLWSFFKALSFEFALALFTARHFYLEFWRSPKSRMFIDQIVHLTHNRDIFNKLKSKNRFEIGHLEQ